MGSLKVGVFVQNFELGVEAGLKKAAEIGADGFQLFCTAGDLLPENMSKEARDAFKKTYEDLGLELSATCCDYFTGLVDEERNKTLIPQVKANIDQAVDLGTSIITTHIGFVPEDDTEPVWDILTKALKDVGRYAEDRGVTLATETGPEEGWVLAKLFERVGSKGISANFDPANFVMGKFDHMKAVEDLAPYITHSHAKDGKWGGEEVPLGEGDVNFPEYIKALKATGFDGYYTIERETGDSPVADITMALEYLRTF